MLPHTHTYAQEPEGMGTTDTLLSIPTELEELVQVAKDVQTAKVWRYTLTLLVF